MSKWRILGRVLGVVIICVGLFYIWLDYSLKRSFQRLFSPQSVADFQDLIVATKGQMGALYLGKMSDLPLPNDGTTALDKTKILLTAYRRNPEKFLKYAKLGDTVLSASIVGDQLLKIPPPGRLPGTSDEVSSLRPDLRKDPWGHPFCIISTSSLIFVVSFGPEDHPSFVCQDIRIDNETRQSKRRVFQMPSGEVILKINRESASHAMAQALSSVPTTPD